MYRFQIDQQWQTKFWPDQISPEGWKMAVDIRPRNQRFSWHIHHHSTTTLIFKAAEFPTWRPNPRSCICQGQRSPPRLTLCGRWIENCLWGTIWGTLSQHLATWSTSGSIESCLVQIMRSLQTSLGPYPYPSTSFFVARGVVAWKNPQKVVTSQHTIQRLRISQRCRWCRKNMHNNKKM